MVGAEGFEPPTLCSQSRCATGLRYAPNTWKASVWVLPAVRKVLVPASTKFSRQLAAASS